MSATDGVPRTAAGRALHEAEHGKGYCMVPCSLQKAILAIEAEAAGGLDDLTQAIEWLPGIVKWDPPDGEGSARRMAAYILARQRDDER